MGREGKRFGVAQRVFVRGTNGTFYVGFIIKVNDHNKECYVTLENDTKGWYPFTTIHGNQRPADGMSDDITCCLCGGAYSVSPNQIVLCDDCGLGYHQSCHNPCIHDTVLEPDAPWSCRLCDHLQVMLCDHLQSYAKKSRRKSVDNFVSLPSTNGLNRHKMPTKTLTRGRSDTKLNGSLSQQNIKQNNIKEKRKSQGPKQEGEKLEGEMKTCQRCNKAECWFIRMMKCKRCKSWFHGGCVQALKWRLLCGDRFYIFVCGDCNGGEDYVKRLPITWSNVAHLAIFNLMLSSFKKYFDLQLEMLPWINKHYEPLHLDPAMHDEGKKFGKRENLLLQAMSSNLVLFKNAGEIKKRRSMWALRERLTPPAPRITLPAKVIVTDKVVESLSVGYQTDTAMKIQRQWCAQKRPCDEHDVFKPKSKRRRLNTEPKQPNNCKSHSVDKSPTSADPDNEDSPRRKAKKVKVCLDTSIPAPSAFEGPNHPFKTALESRLESEHLLWKESILAQYTSSQDEPQEDAESAVCEDTPVLSCPVVTADVEKQWEQVNNEVPHRRKIKVKRLKRGRPTMAEAAHLNALNDLVGNVESSTLTRRCLRSDFTSVSNPATSSCGVSSSTHTATNSGYTKQASHCGATTDAHFQVLGRRIAANGSREYLIKWNEHPVK